jgi:hypothetical protein
MLEPVIVIVWTVPLVLIGMALVGYVHGRRLRVAYAREMIIQITTVGLMAVRSPSDTCNRVLEKDRASERK